MDSLEKAGCRQEAPASSHQAREDGRPLRAWTTSAGRAQAQQRVNSAAGLLLDASGTFSISSDLSGSPAGSNGTSQDTFHGEQHQDKPDNGILDEILEEKADQGDQNQILEEGEEKGNQDSVRKIPKDETVRTVCEQAARNISEILGAELRGGLQAALRKEVLGAELRGGLQAALREEVSRAVREEFQRCSQELRELRPQRILVENGCQADGTTVPIQLQPGHTRSDGNLPLPTQASFPQSQTSSTPCFRTGPAARQNSGLRNRTPPPQEVCRRACLIGADTREGDEGAGAKPPTRLSKKDCCELGVLKPPLDGELFRTGGLRPPEDDGENSCSSQENTHTWVQDADSQHRCDPRYTSPPTGEEGWHSSQTKQDSRWSFSNTTHGTSARRRPNIPGWFNSETSSTNNSKEIVRRDKRLDTAECADEAVHSDISSEGSRAQSAVQRRKWSRLDPDLRVPTVEMLRMKRDEELVSQLCLDDDNGEWDSVAPAPPRDELGRRSWFVALATDIRSQFGSFVAPACAIIPWASTYPWASALYRWVILGLVGKALYHSVSMTYKEWEMGESFRPVVLALDAVMGIGALLGILACGALCRSKVLVTCCKLLLAYARRSGVLTYWEDVSATDFFCTASFWFASVLTVALESLLLEHRPTTEDLLSHVGCFALFAFILMGLSQFAIHVCRCLSVMIDAFGGQIVEQSNFSEALREWILLEALCRIVCSSIQLAFLSLQATAMAVVMLSIQQVGQHDASRLMSLAPGLIVATGVFRTSLWAAAITDKCNRLPMLVNSLSGGSLLDQDRMYTVHYIAYSQAGFYIFDLRLTSSGVLKTVYIACAITFLLATRVFVE
mmetsp:Transcript_119709/g.350072  ORF Transcript_119709/g.350072 Transcript_119709/m.350072 type:complete len:845 (+) Transcript_119709:174-2708(+)